MSLHGQHDAEGGGGISRRSVFSAMAMTASAGLLTACGGSSGGKSSEGSTPGGSGGAFPVTVAHKYGTTVVKNAPKRVVCVGVSEQDSLLALGVVPVGTTAFIGGQPGAIYPWAKDKVGSAKLPTVLSGQKFSVEAVAALRPDLILGIYSAMTSKQYEQLSKLAPTIAPAKGYPDYGTPWETVTQMTADAIGKRAAGKELVAKVQSDLAAAKKSHPQFDGKSAIVASVYQGVYLYAPQDARSTILKALGFSYPARFKNIGGASGFGGSISSERAKEVDFDVVVWLASAAQVRQGTGGLFEQTRAAKQDRVLYIPSSIGSADKQSTYAAAFSLVTPLSIPWLLKRYVPQLAAAVDGKTSTKIPTISQ